MALLPIIDVIGRIVDNVIPDPDKKLEVKLELAKLADQEAARESELLKAQAETNKVEAGHRSLFVAGWRPAVGWICAGALFYNTILGPMLKLPLADLGFLQTILLGMLGLATARTVEKVTGVTNDVLPIFTKKNGEVAPVVEKKKKRKIWPF